MKRASEITEHVRNGLATPSTKSHGNPSSENRLADHWVAAIFKKFEVRYLHRWTSAIVGLERHAVNEWARELAGLTGEQIRRGLDSLPKDWPPTAGEFRELCTGVSETHKENAAMYRDDRPRITDKAHLLSNDQRDARRKRNYAELQRAKEILKGNPKP